MSVIRLIAEVINGLQAPYSIQPKMLGTAAEAWVRLRQELRLMGWTYVEEVERALQERLLEEKKEMFDNLPQDQSRRKCDG